MAEIIGNIYLAGMASAFVIAFVCALRGWLTEFDFGFTAIYVSFLFAILIGFCWPVILFNKLFDA